MTSSPDDGNRPSLAILCLAVFAGALAVRVVLACARPVPMTVDAAYYLMVAENLAAGRGLVADYVWNYLAGVPDGLPVPSNAYWMPGTSLVAAAAYALAKDTSLRVAQWPPLIFGALLCSITAWIAGALTKRRGPALLAGAAAALNYYLVELSFFPDHFMLYAVLVNLALIGLWTAWQGSASYALVAGATAGLAYLTRTDAGLLVIVAAILALGFRRRARRRHNLRIALFFIIAFIVVAAPWWVRQTHAFGSPSGANPLRTAFLTDYNDLLRLDQSHLNIKDYWGTNQRVAFLFKGYVLYRSLRVLAKATMLVGLLAIAALFISRIRRESLPWLIYTPIGLLVPALIVPYAAVKGGSWHMMPAFLPIILALGSAFAIEVHLRVPSRLRPGLWLLILGVFLSPASWWLNPPPDAARSNAPLYPPVAAQAGRALGTDAGPVLTDNAWGLYSIARIPCAQFPTDGADAALTVADTIGAKHFITRADAPDQIPTTAEVIDHPRFSPLARYPAGETNLLVYRILPLE